MNIKSIATKIEMLLPLLRCPYCYTSFSVRNGNSLVCEKNHCFDLSSKGYVNMAPSHNQQRIKYDSSLFASRQAIFAAGFYRPAIEVIQQMILTHSNQPMAPALLDAGCGEGYYLRELTQCLSKTQLIGTDISRDAITAAARQSSLPHWLVANLSKLPIANKSISHVLNILSPADYDEFARILAPDGVLIKMIPGKNYLQEVRKYAAPHLRQAEYSNERVINHLLQNAHIIHRYHIQNTSHVSAAEAMHFCRMTPLTFSFSEETLQTFTFSEITIDLEILYCRLQNS